jgi:hypothetical protein
MFVEPNPPHPLSSLVGMDLSEPGKTERKQAVFVLSVTSDMVGHRRNVVDVAQLFQEVSFGILIP